MFNIILCIAMNKVLILLLNVFLCSSFIPVSGKALKENSNEFYFDVKQTPFSCYGSYMSLIARYDKRKQTELLELNDMSGRVNVGNKNILCVELMDGDYLTPVYYKGTPIELLGESKKGVISIYFENPRVLHFYLKEADLHLSGDWKNSVLHNVSSEYANTYVIGNKNIVLTVKKGKVKYHNNNFQLIREEGVLDIVLEQYYDLWFPSHYTEERDVSLERLCKEYEEWEKKIPTVAEKYQKGRKLASYINWSSVYEPRDYIKRHGMAMSKKRMNRIWSWDHCFNAMGLMYHNPDLSWDQFMFPFDLQDTKTGALPDAVSAKYMIWDYVKPPIHGWTLSHLLKHYTPHKDELIIAYERLVKWTNFWLTCRDVNSNGLPEYNHGNDSGWDNGTNMDVGFPVEGADLAAFLIFQMDELAKLAVKISQPKDAVMWKKKSEVLMKKMIKELWDGNKFITRKIKTGAVNEKSQSLMSYLPIILGKKLPESIRNEMISNLKKEGYLLTSHGLATESPQSTFYQSDGYWRGPVWAPTTLIIADGLRACGEIELAKIIAERFCDTCIAASCFAENFDAVSGKPLRDSSYTWTTSVFLVFAHDYLCE